MGGSFPCRTPKSEYKRTTFHIAVIVSGIDCAGAKRVKSVVVGRMFSSPSNKEHERTIFHFADVKITWCTPKPHSIQFNTLGWDIVDGLELKPHLENAAGTGK
jgi:hypothetical protein